MTAVTADEMGDFEKYLRGNWKRE
jgi:hypothetical protein